MNRKNLIMGRADILLRFLQLTDKDGPNTLDPFLQDLDCESEDRPLVDQIVDRIVAGDEALYIKYAQARKEIGSRNPYSSPEEKKSGAYEEALGFFISQWSKFEKIMRKRAEQNLDYNDSHSRSDPRLRIKSRMWWTSDTIPKQFRRDIDSMRRLRNQVVHNAVLPPPDQLKSAGKEIEEILTRINNMPETDSGHQQ